MSYDDNGVLWLLEDSPPSRYEARDSLELTLSSRRRLVPGMLLKPFSVAFYIEALERSKHGVVEKRLDDAR